MTPKKLPDGKDIVAGLISFVLLFIKTAHLLKT